LDVIAGSPVFCVCETNYTGVRNAVYFSDIGNKKDMLTYDRNIAQPFCLGIDTIKICERLLGHVPE
jgi:hypothetical protein